MTACIMPSAPDARPLRARARARRFEHDLEEVVQHVQEPAQLKEAVKALYRKHASGAPQDADPGGDLQREYKRRAPVRGLADVPRRVIICVLHHRAARCHTLILESTGRYLAKVGRQGFACKLWVHRSRYDSGACCGVCTCTLTALCIATLLHMQSPTQRLSIPNSPSLRHRAAGGERALGRAPQAAGVSGEERGGAEAQGADHHGRAPRGHRALPAGARAAALLPLRLLC